MRTLRLVHLLKEPAIAVGIGFCRLKDGDALSDGGFTLAVELGYFLCCIAPARWTWDLYVV
jgi:hypothetical protein